MPKKETGKSTKKSTTKTTASKKVNTTKKVETKKTTPKKVDTKSTKVEVKKEPTKVVEAKKVVEKETVKPIVKEKKTERKNEKNNISVIVDKVMDNTPFAVSLCVIVILVAILIFTLCIKKVPKTSNGDDIVAKLNGKNITANELYESLKEANGYDALINLVDTFIADKEVKITDEDKDYAKEIVNYYKDYASYYGVDLETFITNYLGIPGVSTEDEFYEYALADYKKTLALRKFVGDSATEDELKDYYKNNFSDKLTVKHILIEVDSNAEDKDAADKEAKDKAISLINELNNTSKDDLNSKFEDLAKNNSDDKGTYSNGGLVEDFIKSEVAEEFFNASNELKDGEYTKEPVKTSFGYHVILKVGSKDADKYEDIKDDVKKAYAENLLSNNAALQPVKWSELRSQYKLSIQDDFIKELYEKAIKNYKDAAEKTEN